MMTGRSVKPHASGSPSPVVSEKDALLFRLAELEALEWLDKQIDKNANNRRMTTRLRYIRSCVVAKLEGASS
jgi:hypothetical protein